MSFKKFEEKEGISSITQLKSSVQKSIRKKILENYPNLEPYIEDILPKKDTFKLIKCKDHVELLADHNGIVQFVKTGNTDFFPTLRLLHKYPFILPHQQVDKGAIKCILNGASIMCPGLTTPGAKMTQGVPKEAIVAIMAEVCYTFNLIYFQGKMNALAIGQMKMSTEEVQSINKGYGVDNLLYLNDGLWRLGEKAL